MYRLRKTLLYMACVVVAATGAAMAQMPTDAVGHWGFEEGSGAVAVDETGNGNDGSIEGSPAWLPGVLGLALEFNGQDVYIETDKNLLNNLDGFTMAGWVNAVTTGTYISLFGQNDLTEFGFTSENGGQIGTWMAGNGWAFIGADYPYTYPSWHHCVLAGDADRVVIYIDGQEAASDEGGMGSGTSSFTFKIGGYVFNGDDLAAFNGLMDDVWLFARRLSQEEIQDLMLGPGGGVLASAPKPADQAVDVPRDVVLGWTPSEQAVTHDVYFGTAFDDVNSATRDNPLGVLAVRGQAGTTYDPVGLLEFEQIYYWRIDEVNGAPDNTIFKGSVWSFTTEPFAYVMQNIVATSNMTSEAGKGPERLVDGSGLNAADQHSTNSEDMWSGTLNAAGESYVQFEFDRVYKLHEMYVWNYNMEYEFFLGMGVKDATIEYSDNGSDWTGLGDFELARGPSVGAYNHNTTIAFEGVAARYVRLTIHSTWNPMAPGCGLSEVRFMYIPAHAREPRPADGATDIVTDVVLSWRAGRDALSHEVAVDTNQQAVADGTAPVVTTDQPSYARTYDLDTTYYWKVNEIAADGSWAGDIWDFSTQEYLVVDDFERYTDDYEAGEAIWQSWIDGWEDNANGSQVGYTTSPFAERVIVHSGKQSMPLHYDNTSAALSEGTVTLSPAQDWTVSGVKSLSLWFHGDAGNTGQLYVRINGVKVPYDGGADDIALATWLPWNIDLSTVTTTLSNVTTLTVGVEGGGSGLVFIDDIRLYARTPQLIEPIQPGTTNLVAYYALDGNANDSSGKGFHGVANGGPTYVAGHDGQAVSLDGVDDHIVIASVGIDPGESRTISGWAKADTTGITEWTDVFGFTGPSSDGQHFDIQCVGATNTTTLGYYGLHRHGWEQDILRIDLEWHHLAATYDGTTVTWHGDGLLIGSQEIPPANVRPPGAVHIGKRQDNANHFPGAVDEVRIYDVALSPAEIAGLAGRTAPSHVPF